MTRNRNRLAGAVPLVAGLFLLLGGGPAIAQQNQQRQDQQRQDQQRQDQQRQAGSMSQQELQMPPSSPIVSISAVLPQGLKVGQEFEYQVQIRNVSDNIVVHELVLEQQTSDSMQIEDYQIGQGTGASASEPQARSQGSGSQRRDQTRNQDAQDQSRNQEGRGRSQSQQSQSQQDQSQQSQNKQDSQQAQHQGQSNRWTISKLNPQESKTIHVRAIAEKEGELSACLAIKSFYPALCMRSTVVKPELELVKKAPDMATLCEEIEFEYFVKNTGTGDAGTFTIRDPLPEGLETTEGKRELEFQVDGLAENDVRKFVASLRATKSGEFSSRAIADLQQGDKARSNKTTTRVREVDLAVQIDGPQTQYIRQPVTYTVLVANKGDAPAADATLSLEFPASANLVRVGDIQQAKADNVRRSEPDASSSPTPARQQGQPPEGDRQQQDRSRSSASSQDQQQAERGDEQPQSERDELQQAQQQTRSNSRESQAQQSQQDAREWRLGTLEPGQAKKVTLTFRFNKAQTVEPKAVVRFVCGDEAAREQAEVRAVATHQTELIALPDLMLAVVDNQGTIPQGEEVVYTIVVENQGDAPDHNVQIQAELPDGLEFVEADGPTDLKSEGRQLQFAPIETLEPDDRAVYKVTAKAAGEGQVFFRIKLSSKGLSRAATAEEPTQLLARTARAGDAQKASEGGAQE